FGLPCHVPAVERLQRHARVVRHDRDLVDPGHDLLEVTARPVLVVPEHGPGGDAHERVRLDLRHRRGHQGRVPPRPLQPDETDGGATRVSYGTIATWSTRDATSWK